MAKQTEITQEDIHIIQNYYIEKGDITRWIHWKTKSALVYKTFPELWRAMMGVVEAEENLRNVVDGLVLPDTSHPLSNKPIRAKIL